MPETEGQLSPNTGEPPVQGDPSKPPAFPTIGRVVHVFKTGGWMTRNGVPMRHPQKGDVVNAWPRSHNANVKITLDLATFQETGLSYDQVMSIPVFDPQTEQQRDEIEAAGGFGYWAEWPPRV
jgi:hypothetical protein